MKTYAFSLLLLCLFTIPTMGQKAAKKIQEIKDEANALYALELANTVSIQAFHDNEFEKEGLKGYFSYRDKDTMKTIFYTEIDTNASRFKMNDSLKKLIKTPSDLVRVSKTFSYKGKSINAKTCTINEDNRPPTAYEKQLFDYRFAVYKEFNADPVTYVKYENTTMSMLMLDFGKEFRIYMITLPNQPGTITFGNDYQFVFNKKDNKLIEKVKLHERLIPVNISYDGKRNDPLKTSFHNHKGKNAPPLITPTDLCLLLLYKGGVEWEKHYVHSDKYTCIYDMYNGDLKAMDPEEFKELTKPREKDPRDLDDRLNSERK